MATDRRVQHRRTTAREFTGRTNANEHRIETACPCNLYVLAVAAAAVRLQGCSLVFSLPWVRCPGKCRVGSIINIIVHLARINRARSADTDKKHWRPDQRRGIAHNTRHHQHELTTHRAARWLKSTSSPHTTFIHPTRRLRHKHGPIQMLRPPSSPRLRHATTHTHGSPMRLLNLRTALQYTRQHPGAWGGLK